ncbi:hypothetical protein Tco_0773396 [Tanacetum coccineum]|uniref:Uncharacterized protein n=1 Tax=Tanacetum coccineum TaxID=301880 RepID=A0ABQ4ZP29_9ASTR
MLRGRGLAHIHGLRVGQIIFAHHICRASVSVMSLGNVSNVHRVTMSSATSDVTYTSVYTDSEPDRAFWGADDEEILEGGIPQVIVLGYDGLPLQPVAPPSPDFILGPENPQTPPVPQDEDECEPISEEDPEGGDDGDDDDDDSSRDDANDEDEDEEDEEEEEHLAPAWTLPDDIPEYVQPPARGMICPYRLRYEIGESSNARPARGWVRDRILGRSGGTGVPEISTYAVRERVDMDSQRVNLLMGNRMTLQETIWMVEEELCSRVALGSFVRIEPERTHKELQDQLDHVYETRFQMQHAELAALQETDRRRQDQMIETLQVIRDMRREMSDMQAELLALREPQRRARQPGPEARIPDHQEASGDATVTI